MNRRAVLGVCIALLAGAACTTFPEPTQEGLVAVRSSKLDALGLRPNADVARYRRVLIDPVPVEFSPGWPASTNAYNRSVSSVRGSYDAPRIAVEMASSLQSILAEAFKAGGYEIAPFAEPGVLRVSARIIDLYVNAPDQPSPWRTKTFTRDAGDAKLLLEVRDAVTGTVLVRVSHHGTATQMGRVALANDVTNRFWFDSLFTRWAGDCVAEIKAAHNRP